MQNKRNDRENQQEVNEPARYMEQGKTADPSDQQDHKQNGPDAHAVPFLNLSSVTQTQLY
jgi:hypothetical protein